MKRLKIRFVMLILCAALFAPMIFSCGGGNGGGSTIIATIVSMGLIRLDGVELAFSDRPIPRAIRVLFNLSSALEDAADRNSFESAVTLDNPAGSAVAGTYEWASDNKSVAFIPERRLDYRTDYTVEVDDTLVTPPSGAMSFTTMARGDVNGDGYSDVIIGAYFAPNGAQDGRVYIFLGSTNGIANKDLASTSADTAIDSKGNDWLGISVSLQGDVNGDGYADAIIGANRSDGGGAGRGEAYVFLGSASGIANCDMATTPDCPHATIQGAADFSDFGASVGFAGDVNGDGYDDIIIGAHNYGTDPILDEPGQAYVFLGGTSLAGTLFAAGDAEVTVTGNNHDDHFGFSVALAGDVNGDGYDDIVIGAPGSHPLHYASIFNGGPSLTGNLTPSANADTTLLGDNNFDGFGEAVYTAGDVNGDGYADVIIGAGNADHGTVTSGGRAYVFLGSASGVPDCDIASDPSCPDSILSGAANDDYLGTSVTTAGNINGDGYDDIIVGADHDKPGGLGYAYLFLGSATGIADCDIATTPTCPAATFQGGAPDDFLGESVSLAGDVNGDGYDDIIMSAPQADGAGTDKGQAYLFLGSDSGIADCDLSSCTADTTFTGEQDADRLGGYLR